MKSQFAYALPLMIVQLMFMTTLWLQSAQLAITQFGLYAGIGFSMNLFSLFALALVSLGMASLTHPGEVTQDIVQAIAMQLIDDAPEDKRQLTRMLNQALVRKLSKSQVYDQISDVELMTETDYKDQFSKMPSVCKFQFCEVCNRTKPPRVEHCPICRCCVIQVDHHCVWIGNTCIGLKNRKFFVLYLFYLNFSAILSTWPYFYAFTFSFGFINMIFDDVYSVIVFLLAMCIWLATLCLLLMQVALIKNNQTTHEFAKSTKQPFRLASLSQNIETVFGVQRMDWWNPFMHPFSEHSMVWFNLEMRW